MNRPRDAGLALLAAACSTLLLVLLDLTGADSALPGIVCAGSVLLVASRRGSTAGGLTGVLSGTGLIYVRWSGGVPVDTACLAALVGLAAVGLYIGSARDRLIREINGLEETELALRRELYNLKKRAAPARVRPERVEGGGVSGRDGDEPARDWSTVDVVALAGAVRSISSSLTEQRVIESMLDAIRTALGASRVTVHLHDRKSDQFLPGTRSPQEDGEVSIGANEPLLRAVLRGREPLHRTDADQRQAYADADAEVQMAAPIFDRAMLTGVVLVCGVRPDDRGGSEGLALITSAAGPALSAARLARRSEKQEKLDPLTGLLGPNAIRESLTERLSRGPVAVLLVTADRIRQVNEKFGRRSGDEAVTALAQLVSLEIGADGEVGRYGGATLLVVLPGYRLEAAQKVGDRLRRRVPSSIHAGPEGLAEPLTVSVGVVAASVGPVDVLLDQLERALTVELSRSTPDSSEADRTARIHA